MSESLVQRLLNANNHPVYEQISGATVLLGADNHLY